MLALLLSIFISPVASHADQKASETVRCETLFLASEPQRLWTRPVLERTRPIRASAAFVPMSETTQVIDLNRFGSTVLIPPRVVEPPTETQIREASIATKRDKFRPKFVASQGYKMSGLLAALPKYELINEKI